MKDPRDPRGGSLPSRNKFGTGREAWIQEKGELDRELLGFEAEHWCYKGKCYDLSQYMSKHPGGKEWLKLTRGMDVTELVETHHLNEAKVQAVLKKYYVKDVERPQVNTRFTWAEDGFYKTLKRRAAEVLKDQPHGPTVFMQAVYGVILTAWACCFAAACVSGSWRFLILSALLLHPILGIGHNSLHQGDNWMRFCLDLTLFSHHEWRVSHCLSHHSYTNLLLDFEMSALEPLIFSIATGPRNGLSFIIGLPVALCSMGGVEFMVRCGHTLMGYRKLAWENLLAVAELALLCAFNGLGKGWAMWAVMHSLGSLLLSIVALPLHHSEHVFTEGQGPISADFGEHTLRTSKDFDTHLGLVPSLLFFQLFNSHCLHHLFPAIDESRLPQLHEVFIKTCADFNMPYKVYTWRELLASTLFAWCLGRPGQGQTTSGSKKAQ